MINTDHMIARRYALDLTQADVAHRVGVGHEQVCRYECGKATPSLRTALALCRVLKTEPSKLLEYD